MTSSNRKAPLRCLVLALVLPAACARETTPVLLATYAVPADVAADGISHSYSVVHAEGGSPTICDEDRHCLPVDARSLEHLEATALPEQTALGFLALGDWLLESDADASADAADCGSRAIMATAAIGFSVFALRRSMPTASVARRALHNARQVAWKHRDQLRRSIESAMQERASILIRPGRDARSVESMIDIATSRMLENATKTSADGNRFGRVLEPSDTLVYLDGHPHLSVYSEDATAFALLSEELDLLRKYGAWANAHDAAAQSLNGLDRAIANPLAPSALVSFAQGAERFGLAALALMAAAGKDVADFVGLC